MKKLFFKILLDTIKSGQTRRIYTDLQTRLFSLSQTELSISWYV